MSIVFSKKRDKRSRSSSNEANQSFVKNVTTRVSGLLPTAITQWFSSPSSSNTNGSAPTGDATDSSTEDEAPESPINTQPPTKRMRYSTPGTTINHYPTDLNQIRQNITTNIDTLEACSTPYSSVQSPQGQTTFRRGTNYVSTPVPPIMKESLVERSDKDSTMFKTQPSVSAIGPSVAGKRKSLFGLSANNEEASKRACTKTSNNTMRDLKEPCFKPSLLGSPFYSGRTTYGGASYSYINQANIKKRTNAIVNESSTQNNTISYSARRVLDLLEHYSSPLSEARRIPQYVSNSNPTPSSSNTSSGTSSLSNKSISYKTQELHVPIIASILQLKSSRLSDTTTAARQIMASHSSTSDYVPYPVQTNKEPSDKLITKVKSRLTRTNRKDELDVPAPVNLPNIVLKIDQDKLPKFTFESPSASNASPSSTPRTQTVTETKMSFKETKTTTFITETPLRKPETISTSIDPYTFSSPVRISSDPPLTALATPKFTFGSPERSIDKIKTSNKTDDDYSCVVGAPKQHENIMTPTNIEKFASSETKSPSMDSQKRDKCSICNFAERQTHVDKCVNCNNISKPPLTKTIDSTKWKCEDCWVNNDNNVDACVCCGSKNPKKSTADSQPAKANDTESEWKCDDCWIKNKSSVDKCAACGGARPGLPKPSVAQFTSASVGWTTFSGVTQNSTYDKITKSQKEKWECTSCLVKNDSDKTKCICCESERTGVVKTPEKKAFNFGVHSSFKFGIDPNQQVPNAATPADANTTTDSKKKVEQSFKFGIDPNQHVPNVATSADVKTTIDSKKKEEQSEKNNNVLAETPTFTFGLPAKKPEMQTESVKQEDKKTDNAPSTNFTFGIPKSIPTTPNVTPIPIFGSTNKLTDSTPKTVPADKEKLQEVPTVNFTIPKTQEAPKPVSNIFAVPLTSQVTQETPLPGAPPAFTSTPAKLDNKQTPSNPLTLPPVTTSTEAPKQSTFSFSTGGIKLAPNLFTAPVSTAATTVISFGTFQTTPTTSTAALFSKIEPTTTSTVTMFETPGTSVSLFQKSEPLTTTTAAPSLGAPAPLFSFGSNAQQTTQPQPEKPKFNFTFGSNNTGSPSLFKTTFGANDNSNSNKFSAPASNTIGSGNALPSNPIGGGNGLATGTSLTGSVLGGNGLQANPLGGGSSEMSNQLSGGNGLPSGNTLSAPPTGIFSSIAQKENLWSSSNNNSSSNLFVSSSATNSLQKPATFTFGSSTPFNAPSPTPAFGSVPQTTPNVFGISNQNNNQGSLFSTSAQNQSASSLFGNAAPPSASNAAPAIGLFGSPNVGAAPTFGTPNSSIPNFEAPSLTPAPAPAFNFGVPQSTGIFGFGQQQQPQQAAGVYSFGQTAGAAPQVQFNMGSAPNTAVRRVRKAVRRNPPR